MPLVVLGIKTAVKLDSKCSEAESVFGRTRKQPGEFINPCTESKELDIANKVD